MKRSFPIFKSLLFCIFPTIGYAQTQVVGLEGNKIINFESFTPENPVAISEELMQFTNTSFYSHPEFGKNPYDTPCEDCIELVDRRTENSRYFIKKGSLGSYFFKQTSSGDLHYKNEKGEFISVDARLKPTGVDGIFIAKNQNFPTSLNMNLGYSELFFDEDRSVQFNKNIKLYSTNSFDGVMTSFPKALNYSEYTIGDDGCRINNAWSGINTEINYYESSIETDYKVSDLSAFNIDAAYTVIEENLILPNQMKIIYDQFEGSFNENGLWVGDLLLVDENELEFVRFGRPFVYDSDTIDHAEKYPFISGYKVIKNGEEYKIQLFVSNDYLKSENRIFPITIDPLVSVTTNWTGTNGSSTAPAFCPLVTNVATPANSTLTNATLYWEVRGSPGGDCAAAPANRCYLNKAQVYIQTSCGTYPAAAGFVSVCAGACAGYGLWTPTVTAASLVTCRTPSCASYTIPFTFYLNQWACLYAACATACIRVERFNVTIEGHTIEPLALIGAIGMDTYTILDCITQTATFTANVLYGVPPYSYTWSPSGGTGATDTDVYPLGVTVVTLTVTDACGNIITDNVTVTNPCLLPISLTSFNGYHADGKNYLHWTTESEKNSELFFIERSFDGLSFEAIGSLPAAGNSNAIIDYNFIDTKPGASINYYRLKEKDLDGTTSYSGIIAIRSEQLNVNSIALNSSNPTSGELNVSVVSAMEGNGNFEIIDISGRIIFNKNIFLNTGINSVMLYPGQIAAGTYILKFTKNDQFETIKFESF